MTTSRSESRQDFRWRPIVGETESLGDFRYRGDPRPRGLLCRLNALTMLRWTDRPNPGRSVFCFARDRAGFKSFKTG